MQTGQPRAYAWNRFATPHFSIAAALEGAGHEFTFEGFAVRVKLPPATRAGDDDDARLRITDRSAGEAPVQFDVCDVDVEVDQHNTAEILALVESRGWPARDVDLVADVAEFAGRAFDHWLRIVRWRTKQWRIGRPGAYLPATFGACTLYEHRINRRLSEPIAALPTTDHHVTLEQWAEIQATLSAHLRAPLFYDLYFDGREHLAAQDLRRAVMDFASACEVLLKTLLDRRMPEQRYGSSREYLLGAQRRALLNGFAPSLLEPCVEGVLRLHRQDLDELFAASSDVLHSDHPSRITEARCVQFGRATSALLTVGEQALHGGLVAR